MPCRAVPCVLAFPLFFSVMVRAGINPEDNPEEPDEATMKAAEVSQQAHLAEETSMAELAAANEDTQQSTEELKAAQKSYRGTLVREEKKLVQTHTHTHTHTHTNLLPLIPYTTNHTHNHTPIHAHNTDCGWAQGKGAQLPQGQEHGDVRQSLDRRVLEPGGARHSVSCCLFSVCDPTASHLTKTFFHAFAVTSGFTPMPGVFLTC